MGPGENQSSAPFERRMSEQAPGFDLPSYDPYDFFDNTTAPGQSYTQTFLAGMPGPKTIQGTAHDDSCLDSCNGAGYHTGPNRLNVDNWAMIQPRNKSTIVNTENPYLQQNIYEYGFTGASMSYGDGGIFDPNAVEHLDNRAWPNVYGEHVPRVVQDRFIGTQQAFQDEDNRSEACSATTCDSHCDLSDPCTGEACADEDDACTDRNCPEKNCEDMTGPSRLPPEVVSAAATLAKIGVGPEYQGQSYDISPQPLLTPALPEPEGSFGQDFAWTSAAEASLADISHHILWAHRDPNSSSCTGPCLLDNPMIFGHCHFPHVFNTDSFGNSFTNISPFPAPDGNSYGGFNHAPHDRSTRTRWGDCGRQISNPHDFVNHFNAEHRDVFVNSMLQADMTRRALPCLVTRPDHSPYSTNIISRALSATPHTSSPQEPFPPTPKSLSQRPGTGSRLTSACHSRSSSAVQVTTGAHRCLWCNDESGEPCGRIFADAEDLHVHVSQDHIKTMEKRGPDGFVCCWENCKRDEGGKKGFPQRSKIERHMQTHIGRKPFQCQECGNRFSARQALEQHRLIHTNEKPLVCNWPGCDQTFRQQSALTMHRRTHTKEKPLHCPYCDKAFSESSNLSKHKRIHEGKGKFTCDRPRCGKSFHRKDQLRRHTNLHEQKEADLDGRRLSLASSISAEEEGLDEEAVGVVRSGSEFEEGDLRGAKRQKMDGFV